MSSPGAGQGNIWRLAVLDGVFWGTLNNGNYVHFGGQYHTISKRFFNDSADLPFIAPFTERYLSTINCFKQTSRGQIIVVTWLTVMECRPSKKPFLALVLPVKGEGHFKNSTLN
jgi:hypothetical protein